MTCGRRLSSLLFSLGSSSSFGGVAVDERIYIAWGWIVAGAFLAGIAVGFVL